MGERKGQNFYYPPDFNYKTHKSLNNYHGSHALRERAKKIDQGILVIRFEMPYNIWCLGCHNHVGMGVRYNAEKKKVGMYYTTPVYEFRMKCHLCDNYYVIRTDPKNFDYALVEGCSRQDHNFDPTEINQVGAVDAGYAHKLAADAMFKKEHEEGDRSKAADEESRVERVEWIQERMKDDMAANSYLRAQFRKEKKSLNDQRVRDDVLRGKLSIGTTKLLPETDEDRKIASMITRYKDVRSHDDAQSSSREKIGSRRIFEASAGDFDEETPSSSTPSSSSTNFAASERLKATMKLERDKRINDTFSTGFSGGIQGKRKTSTKSLKDFGIVIKSRRKNEEEPEAVIEEVESPPPPENVQQDDDEKQPGPSKPAPASDAPNAISLIAQLYGGTSSPSDDSE